ncbi:interferon kappa-like [Anolis carolinensis]|uniref:interferon kappa-like n=1 Tax=Anolis carolinensis TaxID=28377 RepID=UPI0004629A35|nr:PREDICTED: interferon kappa-like [Anolis carolinensis]|eukprot:XP_008101701.1 PREDICTED: interferon kappa-like [Anolis carolinensis]
MITKGWLLPIALTMVLITEVSSQDCGQLLARLRQANKANLELLNSKMNSTIPQQCIEGVFSFSLKNKLPTNRDVSEEENAKVAIQEVLQQTGHIFRQNCTEMLWDEDSLRAFHAGLDQQSENLKSCLSASPRSRRIQLTSLRVKRYFRSLNDFLKEKEYNRCAWEIIQIQVKQCFLWIEKLIQEIQSKA